jgi:protease-4
MDLGVRPFGNELLTLFGDFAVQHRQAAIRDGVWSVGGVVEPLPGIRLVGRYFDTQAVSIGIQLSLGRAGIGVQTMVDSDGKRAFNTYSVRVGAYDRNVLRPTVGARQAYVPFDLKGPMGYQRFAFFDESKKLAEVLAAVDAAKDDPAVAGIAINTSGMMIDREKLWELRQSLKDFKTTGKRVVIFVDRPGIDAYHFASVADKIVMDPVGMLSLEGYVLGRTFFKGTLEKLGIGYDEWRFFKYKSAAETFSRDRMSDADREQRQRLVDEFYRIARADIVESRGMTGEDFDRLVDSTVIFLASDVLRLGLVDTLARWEGVKEMITRLEGKERRYMPASSIEWAQLPYDARWGEPPKIAIIYALGSCAMDEGITARKLVKDVEAAVDDRNVKGIVLRVDSPGGDAVASDYIAEALKKAKVKKPVIVSQGAVAASGGYWLSMYADTIVAAPMTMTGSIGVIGGWMYDNGLKEKIGLSTDLVKAGEHADLGFGFALPLVGGLPDRNMTPEERARAEYAIRSMYKEFVEKVASGRRKSFDDIESVAQGRVWSGADGRELGLVDLLGSLTTAIDVARSRAGIAAGDPFTIVEYPRKGLFDLSILMPRLIGIEPKSSTSDIVQMIKLRLEHNGQPMPVLSLEDLDLTAQH